MNKEYKIEVSDSARVKYGSTNKDDPKVIYVSCNCWIKPTAEMDYTKGIASVKTNLRQKIGDEFLRGKDFMDKLILGYDVNQENFTEDSRKFLTVDFYLIQQGKIRKLKELNSMMQDKMGRIVNGMVEDFENKGFAVAKKKTELN